MLGLIVAVLSYKAAFADVLFSNLFAFLYLAVMLWQGRDWDYRARPARCMSRS